MGSESFHVWLLTKQQSEGRRDGGRIGVRSPHLTVIEKMKSTMLIF